MIINKHINQTMMLIIYYFQIDNFNDNDSLSKLKVQIKNKNNKIIE